MQTDHRLESPSAARNRDPILKELQRLLPSEGLVLEIASGTGEHAVHFAAALPGLAWQPSEPKEDMRASIVAWRDSEGLANVRDPLAIDVLSEAPWPIDAARAIVCINMIHIAPWAATPALMAGAGRALADGGPLILYGPYRRAGVETAASNEAFDASLKERDPSWGLRDLETVEEEARRAGLDLHEVIEMPANNLIVVFRKASAG